VNSFLVLRALSNNTTETHFGLVATRRIGNAVVRNKIRRRLKEILREVPVRDGWDLVFIVRKRSVYCDYDGLSNAVNNLLRRGGLLRVRPIVEPIQ